MKKIKTNLFSTSARPERQINNDPELAAALEAQARSFERSLVVSRARKTLFPWMRM
jgi:hypothetical protein